MQPVENRSPFWGFGDLAAWISLALPAFLGGGLLVHGLFVLLGIKAPGRALELLLAQFLGFGIWFAALLGIFRLRYGEPFWPSLGWVVRPGTLARSLQFGILLSFGIGALGVLLRTPDVPTPMKEFLNEPLALAMVSVLAVTIGPLAEELAFRGFVQPLLVRTLGPVPGIVLTALPFALLHGQQHSWLWQPIVLIGVAGSAFGWVRHRTGSTAASTVMHAAYNFMFVIAYHLQQRMQL